MGRPQTAADTREIYRNFRAQEATVSGVRTITHRLLVTTPRTALNNAVCGVTTTLRVLCVASLLVGMCVGMCGPDIVVFSLPNLCSDAY